MSKHTARRRSVGGGHPDAHADGGGLRRVPRHALQGEELRRVRGHAGPPHDALLLQRQRAHLRRGAQRAHGLQRGLRGAQVPREERCASINSPISFFFL